MPKRKLSTKPHTLTRTRDDGQVFTYDPQPERRARSAMLYSIHYNSNATKTDANRAADAIEVGEPFTFGRYTYLIHETKGGQVTMSYRRVCQYCGRVIVFSEDDGKYVDPEATGDDSIWREYCDSHDTLTAEHEPIYDEIAQTPTRYGPA